jgi:exodeoxyribonuclease VII small subunit
VPRTEQSTSDSADVATFEAAYRELQQVIAQLDDGGLGLEDAVRLFERGQQLVKRCQGIVDEAELRVTRLAAESAGPAAEG